MLPVSSAPQMYLMTCVLRPGNSGSVPERCLRGRIGSLNLYLIPYPPFSEYVPDRIGQAIRSLRICTRCSDFTTQLGSAFVPDNALSLNVGAAVNYFLVKTRIQKILLWCKSLTPKALFLLQKLLSPKMYLSCGFVSADVPVCGWRSGFVARSSIGVPHRLRMCTCSAP